MDTLTFIMAVEGDGEDLTTESYIDGMANMIKIGTVWHLQGSWQRAACAMIEQGYIDPQGNVLCYPEEV